MTHIRPLIATIVSTSLLFMGTSLSSRNQVARAGGAPSKFDGLYEGSVSIAMQTSRGCQRPGPFFSIIVKDGEVFWSNERRLPVSADGSFVLNFETVTNGSPVANEISGTIRDGVMTANSGNSFCKHQYQASLKAPVYQRAPHGLSTSGEFDGIYRGTAKLVSAASDASCRPIIDNRSVTIRHGTGDWKWSFGGFMDLPVSADGQFHNEIGDAFCARKSWRRPDRSDGGEPLYLRL